MLALLLGCAAPSHAHAPAAARLRAMAPEIAAHPGDATLLLRRAQVREEAGDLDAARADLLHARALDPEIGAVDVALARLELEARRPGDALDAAMRALAKAPQDALALMLRARAMVALRRDAACDAWLAAIAAAEREGDASPDAYLEAGRACDPPRAASLLERACARLGDPPALVVAAIAAERAAGRVDDALARCRAAADRAQGPALPWLVLEAELLSGAGRSAEARVAAARALDDFDALAPRLRTTSWAQALRVRASAVADAP